MSSSGVLAMPPQEQLTPQDMWAYTCDNCISFVYSDLNSSVAVAEATSVNDDEGLLATTTQHRAPPDNASCVRSQPFCRVTVFAKYGPGVRVAEKKKKKKQHSDPSFSSSSSSSSNRDWTVKLKGGCRGSILQPHEVKQLIDEEHRSFLCEVYSGGDGVTQPIGVSGRSGASKKYEVSKSFVSTTQKLDASHARYTLSTSIGSIVPTFQNLASTKGGESLSVTSKQHQAAAATITGMANRSSLASPAALRSLVAPNVASTALKDEVYGELMNRRHPLTYQASEITEYELRDVLERYSYPRAEKDGKPLRWSTIADAVSTCLLAERERRIQALKSATPSLSVVRHDPRITNRQPVFFYSRSHPKVRDIRRFDNPQEVLVALHRYAFQVSDVDPIDNKDNSNTNNTESRKEKGRGKPSAVELNNNIKCLRSDFVADPLRPGWDGTSCLKGHNGRGNAALQRQANDGISRSSRSGSSGQQLRLLPPLADAL